MVVCVCVCTQGLCRNAEVEFNSFLIPLKHFFKTSTPLASSHIAKTGSINGTACTLLLLIHYLLSCNSVHALLFITPVFAMTLAFEL